MSFGAPVDLPNIKRRRRAGEAQALAECVNLLEPGAGEDSGCFLARFPANPNLKTRQLSLKAEIGTKQKNDCGHNVYLYYAGRIDPPKDLTVTMEISIKSGSATKHVKSTDVRWSVFTTSRCILLMKTFGFGIEIYAFGKTYVDSFVAIVFGPEKENPVHISKGI